MAWKKSKAFTTIVVLLVVLVVLLSIKLMMTSWIIDWNTDWNNVVVDTNAIDNTKPEENKPEVKNEVKEEIVNNNENNSTVSNWDVVTVDYIGKHTDWVVFDTSVEAVAKEAWVYQTWRDYKNWLTFQAWAWQMIAWFDKAVIGMKVWEQKTITLEPKDAYGERTEDNVQTVPLDQLPPKADNSDYIKWDILQSQYGPVTIMWTNESWAQIDFNNPMAGKTLIFDLAVKNIQKAK